MTWHTAVASPSPRPSLGPGLAPWTGILYCSHDWKKIMVYIKKRAILLKRKEVNHDG
jgi:hypothetical protein